MIISNKDMGNWERKQEEKREGKEKDKLRKEKLAGFFYDSAKLILGGLVIGGISPLFMDSYHETNLYIVLIGTIATYIFARIGNEILK